MGTDAATANPATLFSLSSLSDIVTVVHGDKHACILGGQVDQHRVYCWGDNGSGQLGDGQGLSRNSPDLNSPVTGLEHTFDLAAGGDHTCAIDKDAAVWCWGEDSWGQLGDGGTSASNVPIQTAPGEGGVNALQWARAVAAGAGFSCAINQNSEVMCWGRNDMGQLGDGQPESRYTPVHVLKADFSRLKHAQEIRAGRHHACAKVLENSTYEIYCWGHNDHNQAAADSADIVRNASKVSLVGGPNLPVAIAPGLSHTCILDSNDDVWCWGDNSKKQLGQDIGSSSITPVQANQ